MARSRSVRAEQVSGSGGREILELEGSAWRHPVPRDLENLPRYAADAKLCARWEECLASWRVAFPDVDVLAEVRKAYAFEVVRGFPKKDRARFLANWLSRSQEWAERRLARSATAPRGSQFGRAAPVLAPFRPKADGFDLDQEMREYLQQTQLGRAQA